MFGMFEHFNAALLNTAFWTADFDKRGKNPGTPKSIGWIVVLGGCNKFDVFFAGENNLVGISNCACISSPIIV